MSILELLYVQGLLYVQELYIQELFYVLELHLYILSVCLLNAFFDVYHSLDSITESITNGIDDNQNYISQQNTNTVIN